MKKVLLFIFMIILYSIVGGGGLFLIGITFDFFLFVFSYFYSDIPMSISFEDYKVERLLRMSIGGGIILGISVFIIQLSEMKKR
ncbi:hypothetical protein [Proteus terrae]|uniref:hypothetical protein n=1 Tax=Proteus terrae TaxID=1574161 RepID=UPI0018C70AF0|nr:hypothetical protein [Proteus terrae]MBG2837776.1 hypothetical protein [Proteus terrae subsp. cibarius]MBG2869753.1 hypothetical protein [Proteus terrae subsp. cibarius]MBJ2111138.1 hypothetical protein [Proteus terrae]MBJ2134752.1 hypothetical protein [Proteus terrae]MCS6714923.1 hypothetical protein [Proteus terrae]